MSLTVGHNHNPTNQLPEEAKEDFFQQLPNDMILEIFSHLNDTDRAKCSQASKKWYHLANHSNLLKVIPPAAAFGKEKWKTYFGDVGKEPPLPANIRDILKSPCLIWKGKKIRDTHMLVLIPQTVNGKPLTKKSLGEFAKKYFPSTEKGYRYIWSELIDEKNDKPIDKSYWVLMTKDVIPGSRNESYVKQQIIVSDLAKKALITYEVPESLKAAASIFSKYVSIGTLLYRYIRSVLIVSDLAEKALSTYEVPESLEAAVSIFSKYVSSGTRLFNDNPYTYTRCQDKVQGYQMVVGGFASSGISFHSYFGNVNIGVAALRKF